MSSPQKENSQAKFAGGLISGAINIVKNIVIKLAEGKIPWLNFWPVKQIFEYFVNKFFDKQTTVIVNHSTGAIIDAQVSNQVEKAEDKTQNLKNAITNGDPNAIKKAEQEFDDAMEDLVTYNGSHSN